jgi:hypothetical protein
MYLLQIQIYCSSTNQYKAATPDFRESTPRKRLYRVLELLQIQSQEEVRFQLAACKLPIVLIFISGISKAFNRGLSL